ncbi:hypothetical protein [Mesorhizobium sp. CAU 1741]|uniref:hypothetical protein n=1 Tax=Mesorhizobium sp. CAU 1741 TaxID=3140366 RepID=UPI00325B29EA
MSIIRHGTRLEVACDTCPASYPNTYAAEDFGVMVADAKSAGWIFLKAGPKRDEKDTSDLFGSAPRVAVGKAEEPFGHTCPACANPLPRKGLF